MVDGAVDSVERQGDQASGDGARPLAQHRVRTVAPETDRTLELRFDDTPHTLVDSAASAALDANDGARSIVGPANWYYLCEGTRRERGTGSVIYRPIETGEVALDVVDVDSDSAPEGGRGRFDESVSLDSKLPIDPVPVSAREQISELCALGEEALAAYQAKRGAPSDSQQRLQRLVGELSTISTDVEDCFTGFDFSLERFEQFVLSDIEEGIGTIESEWLRGHALEHDAVEQLIVERASSHPPERAADLYYALVASGGEAYGERALSALARHPDEKAVHALLLCLWDDDPDRAPRAIEILGTLLESKATFDENDDGIDQQKVLRELRNYVEFSDYPEIRTAAIETLADLDPADPTLLGRDELVETIEGALEDPDEDVRAAAEDALERLA